MPHPVFVSHCIFGWKMVDYYLRLMYRNYRGSGTFGGALFDDLTTKTGWRTFNLVDWPRIAIRYCHRGLLKIVLAMTSLTIEENLPSSLINVNIKYIPYTIVNHIYKILSLVCQHSF